ncbi:hypothetical protein H0H93_016302 [Arthromyces matolae]|nr:hypothetical protein H0H93_016302 [Arthromyces matolae]
MRSKILLADHLASLVGRVTEESKREFLDETLREKDVLNDFTALHVRSVTVSDRAEDRKITMLYRIGSEKPTLEEELHIISKLTSEAISSGSKERLSCIICLDDPRIDQPSKRSRNSLDFVGKYVEKSNVVVVTIGWDDDDPSGLLQFERRQKELLEEWKSFVQRGISVLRLSSPGKTSDSVFHTSQDILKLVITRFDEGNSGSSRNTWKTKGILITAEDEFMDDPMDTDVVIPIMGPTGAGKSTVIALFSSCLRLGLMFYQFINTIVGRDVTTVGHDLKSQTATLQHVIMRHPKDPTRRLIIVDTPGFDDTYVSDSEILRRIAVWLARSYSANMKLAGVVYLHEICQSRMLGTARKNLDMFNKLVGEGATQNVILATTKWNDIPEEVGERREEQLRERHWRWMFDLGARPARFTGSFDSGWDILHLILDSTGTHDVNTVEIQKEIVEIKKILPDTQAGQTLRYTLEELLETQRIAATQLRKDDDSPEVRKMIQDTDRIIHSTTKQLNDLSAPLAHRLGTLLRKLAFSSLGART